MNKRELVKVGRHFPSLLVGIFCFAQTALAQGNSNLKVAANVAYVHPPADSLQKLDIYFSAKKTAKRPVVIYIHGGGFVSGDKVSAVGSMPQFFNDHGFVFVSINYRLSPAFHFPAHVKDLASAIAWVKGHISGYGGDGRKIYLIGHSAGAQLAALVTTDRRYLSGQNLSLQAVSKVVLLDGGAYDVTASLLAKNKLPVDSAAFGNNPAVWRQASPVCHITAGKDIPPYLIFFIPTTGQSAQAVKLAKLLRQARVRVLLKKIEHKNHRALNDEFAQEGDSVGAAILDFLR